MALFKCKMCGGSLEVLPGATVMECEYCGTQQTLPKLDDERRANLYDRANHFRRNNEFDKAMGIYEQILNEDASDSEAYWSLVLCRYGIEYVEDPTSRKRIPTVNRAQFTSVFDDDNYKSALKYADSLQKRVYEAEAKTINEIQKGILAISQKEEPFDVFICYKETDNNGRRTPDSVLANDLYHQLTQEGFKVFFARITLEDKLGSAYEPYIFAALNSAKVMVALGTKPEYFKAVWVKNEWSRYLSLIKQGQKKILIPAYKDMDPYDLPEEFSHLQAQDMSKLGFMQDLIRGIKKIAQPGEEKTIVMKETAAPTSGNITPLLKRAFMFLEDGEWDRADDFCEQVLNIDPECAQAYVGKLLVDLRVQKQTDLKNCDKPFDSNNNYKKAIRFADETLRSTLTGYIDHINTRNENTRLEGIYSRATALMRKAKTEQSFRESAELFESIAKYKDSASLAKECSEKAEVVRKDDILYAGKAKMTGGEISRYEAAIYYFQCIPGWRDADEQVNICKAKIEELKEKEKATRLEREHRAEIVRKEAERKAKRNKKIAIITTPIICAMIAFIIVLNTVIIPNSKYKNAVALMDDGKYTEAIASFKALDGYKDSADKISECNTAVLECKYNDAIALMNSGKYTEAINAFDALDGYKDSANKISECKYNDAERLLAEGQLYNAAILFHSVGDHKDGRQRSMDLWETLKERDTLNAGGYHTVGLRADGTVVAVGDNDDGQCDVSSWTDIVAVSAGGFHTVGLRADGTVVAVGDNYFGQCDVSSWTDIVAVSAGVYHTVGLRTGGTVVAVGWNDYGQCNVSSWTDIVAVSAGGFHTVGLRADGTVVAVGWNDYSQRNVSSWTDIVAVSAGSIHTVGLRADGTVVAVGDNYFGQCDVSSWTDIVAVSAGSRHTVGLRADGTVVAVGDNNYGRCDVSSWTDIVAVSAGEYHTVGLRADGTVVAVGRNDDGQCNVSSWTDIKLSK